MKRVATYRKRQGIDSPIIDLVRVLLHRIIVDDPLEDRAHDRHDCRLSPLSGRLKQYEA